MPRKVEIAGLSKWFGELEALRGIDLCQRFEFAEPLAQA